MRHYCSAPESRRSTRTSCSTSAISANSRRTTDAVVRSVEALESAQQGTSEGDAAETLRGCPRSKVEHVQWVDARDRSRPIGLDRQHLKG